MWDMKWHDVRLMTYVTSTVFHFAVNQEGLSDRDVEAAVQKLNSTAGSSAAKRLSNLPRSQLHSLKLPWSVQR